MFINIGRNRTILFIRQVTGPTIPINPGIPVKPTPPNLPYPVDNILIETLPGFNQGLGIDFATQYINSVYQNVPSAEIKAFDFKSIIDAADGLANINQSQYKELLAQSIDQVNAAEIKLTIIDNKGYLLPDGTSFIVELINIEGFNEGDITDVLETINNTEDVKKDKFTLTDLYNLFNEG